MHPTTTARPLGDPVDTSAELARVVARAMPLHERLRRLAPCDDAAGSPEGPPERPPAHAADDARLTTLLAAWRAASANGDAAAFRTRLAWDGWDEARVRAALASEPAENGPLPPWAEFFARAYGATRDALAASFALLPGGRDRALGTSAPMPFEELLVPLIARARQDVRDRAGATYDLAAAAAHVTLERALLERLVTVLSHPLYTAFTVFRALRQHTGLAALLAGRGGSRLYDEFVAHMRGGALFGFFEEYPVAARLCATAATQWVDTGVEFLARVAADRPAIGATFGRGAPLGRVAELTLSLADPHEGGRAVFIARWECGTRAVYKPRDVALECRFAELVDAVNAALDESSAADAFGLPGAAPRLRRLTPLPRAGYGWIEFAESAPCDSEAGAARYYERCGMLLCLAYAMNGTDFHLENLIASGEHPLLIDMETLLVHEFPAGDESGTSQSIGAAGLRAASASVLKARMLPGFMTGHDGTAHDIGALGGTGETDAPAAVRQWEHVNTDLMRLTTAVFRRPRRGRHTPLVGGAPVDAAGFLEPIVAGFRRAYAAILRIRGALAAPGGLLDRVRDEPVRFILRNTQLYTTLIARTLHPQFLRDGLARSVELDALARPFLLASDPPPAWPLLADEHEALERLDVPLFTAPAAATGVVSRCGAGRRAWAPCFDTSAHVAAATRLASLSDADCARQVALTRSTFAAFAARDLHARVEAVQPRAVPPAGDGDGDGTTRLRAAALAWAGHAAAALRARAVVSPNGEAGWLGVTYVPAARRYIVGPVGHGVFDGYAGYALFLAAVARVAPEAGWRECALATARALAASAEPIARTAPLRRSVDVGAGTGLGGTVYALTHLAEWLGEPTCRAAALTIARAMTPEIAAAAPDALSGLAGAVIALTVLHERGEGDESLDLARALGGRLLASRLTDEATGLRGWRSSRGALETGIAHGQAGIAMALARLGAAAGDNELLGAAAEAFALERAALGRDPDSAAHDSRLAAWSRGAAGVGLARIGASALAGDADIRRDVEAAVDAARAHLLDGVDSVCCGVMARAELLLSAADALGRPDLRGVAHGAAADVLARAAARGAFTTGWDESSPVGLFHGSTGVAYQLLRTAFPGRLPSLLRWQ